MDLNKKSFMEKSYMTGKDFSTQSLAYALAEYLDRRKNMITQTMRTRRGYIVQCKGDATAEWTKYLGLDAALSINLEQYNEQLNVSIGVEKWTEKLGIAALGMFVFTPLVFTSGIGVFRQMTLCTDIYSFVEDYLGERPIEQTPAAAKKVSDTIICPQCETENRADAHFCKFCGEDLQKKVTAYCPNCAAELEGDEIFCPKCGADLRNG